MNRSNGYRSPRKIFSSDSNCINDHLGATMIEGMDINNILSSKTVKSSTLNRHQLTKPKSPGRINPNQEFCQKI
jgi:hypothetical protein